MAGTSPPSQPSLCGTGSLSLLSSGAIISAGTSNLTAYAVTMADTYHIGVAALHRQSNGDLLLGSNHRHHHYERLVGHSLVVVGVRSSSTCMCR